MSRVLALGTVFLWAVLTAPTAWADDPTPQPGPSLNPPQNQGLGEDAKQKLIIVVVVAALLAIVWYGRRVRKRNQSAG
ncbi:hypothetical protein GCM10010174_10520 [Kutzneria viridogrisea]|uniref:Secreted protein n=2 Tax=Kutzneria TaxID=43356 RepID=W5WT58_9PSEU|nr:hypothetical protein [Kutzneria albida]AHI01345.1 hypothetical protein KALB_7987 [Kutzneria albida DSM 43870]MBA8926598.1 hypothetical protein [Kutzneria viridogrisea]